MAGGKRKPVRPWLSAAVLRTLWELTPVKRIAVRRYSRNGVCIVTLLSNIKREKPGIVWCIKEFTCSKDLSRMIGSASRTHGKTSKSKYLEPLRKEASLSLTSTRLAKLMVLVA